MWEMAKISPLPITPALSHGPSSEPAQRRVNAQIAQTLPDPCSDSMRTFSTTGPPLNPALDGPVVVSPT